MENQPLKFGRGSFKYKETQKAANLKSRGVKRPNRKGGRMLLQEAKKEIIKAELLKAGYLEQVHKYLPSVMKAHFKVASMSKVGATGERKLMFETSGMKSSDNEQTAQSIGEVLAQLAAGQNK
jgi:hypothetical protein